MVKQRKRLASLARADAHLAKKDRRAEGIISKACPWTAASATPGTGGLVWLKTRGVPAYTNFRIAVLSGFFASQAGGAPA